MFLIHLLEVTHLKYDGGFLLFFSHWSELKSDHLFLLAGTSRRSWWTRRKWWRWNKGDWLTSFQCIYRPVLYAQHKVRKDIVYIDLIALKHKRLEMIAFALPLNMLSHQISENWNPTTFITLRPLSFTSINLPKQWFWATLFFRDQEELLENVEWLVQRFEVIVKLV